MKETLTSLIEDLKFFLFIFYKPKKLFNYIKSKPRPFIPILIFLSLMILTFLLIASFFQERELSNSKSIRIIFFTLFAFIFYLFILFFKSLLISIGIKLLKGKCDSELLYIAFMYCMTPFLLAFSVLLLFPITQLNIWNIMVCVFAMTLARLYEIILSIVAISALADFSYGKSVLVFLPWLIIWIFIGI